MIYNNTFNINNYFATNYGLPDKPKKYKWVKKNLLITILFCWIWIPLYFYKTSQANKAISDWEAAYQYRLNNWYKEYEKFYKKAFDDLHLYQSGLVKLGLVEDQVKAVKPFYVFGPTFDGYWRETTSGGYRSSKHEFTYIFFTDDQIYFYTRKLDLLDLNKKSESTLEFFFSDITSVGISTTSITPKNAGIGADGKTQTKQIDQEQFVLVVPGDKINFAYTGNDQTAESINGMKHLIRQKKMESK